MNVTEIAKDRKTLRLGVSDKGQVRSLSDGEVLAAGEDELNIVYAPGQVTVRVEGLFRSAVQDGQGYLGALAAALSAVLLEWDLTEPNGSMVPTSLERLSDLPGGFVAGVAGAIFAEGAPSGEASAPSASS